MLRKLTIIAALACLAAFAQDYARHSLYFYDISGNLEYICSAASEGQGTTTWTITGLKTLINVAVASDTGTATTSTAHGLTVGATVTIAGATVKPKLNATYTVLTVPLATTFTIATAGVDDGTYTDATMTLAYVGPRTTAAVWSIQKFFYDASNNLYKSAYAVGTGQTPGRVPTDRICASRVSYEYR